EYIRRNGPPSPYGPTVMTGIMLGRRLSLKHPALEATMRIPNTGYIGQQKTGSALLRSYFTQHPGIAWTRHATMFQLDPFDPERYLTRFENEKDCDCLVDMYEGLSVGYHFGEAAQW